MNELKQKLIDDTLKVGDEVIVTDLIGESVYLVADIREKYIYFMRKYVLPEEYDKDHREINGFLNGEFLAGFKDEIKSLMGKRKKEKIFLPREIEVFGHYVYSDPQEKGKMWAIFKNPLSWGFKDEDGNRRWTWLASPGVSDSAYFCYVSTSGAPGYGGASSSSGVLPCFKINRETLGA